MGLFIKEVIPLLELPGRLQKLIAKLPAEQGQRLYLFLTNDTNIKNVGLWISAVVAGLIGVAYALMFRGVESLFHSVTGTHAWLTFILSPVFLTASWLMVWKFSPEAGGSGIPQIIAANEMDYNGSARARVDALLSLKTGLVKIVSSLLAVAGGGAIGREGPTLQLSACVFHFFGQKVRRFVPTINEHTWIVAGAAAGLASAFNTPLGGIVYAIEELGIVHFHRIRTALISAVIVSGLVAQWILGSYLYLGFPVLERVTFSVLPVVMLVAVVCGLAGGAFGRLLYRMVRRRMAIKQFKRLLGITLLSSFGLALLIYLEPRASGAGNDIMTDLLFRKDSSSVQLIGARFASTILSYVAGGAGGIFAPSLAMGATIGSWISHLFNTSHDNLMVIIGMISFLSGVTRTPFTSFILVLEMTDRHSAIFPMMLAALVAQGAAQFIDPRSFYDHMKERYLAAQQAADLEASKTSKTD